MAEGLFSMTKALQAMQAGASEGENPLLLELQGLKDPELIARTLNELPSCVDGYREILRRYESIVYNTCAKMIGDAQEAEEATQDTFLQVFHKLYQFEGRASFKTWLFRIAYNFCLARRAKLAKRREKQRFYDEEFVTEDHSYEGKMQLQDISEQVQAALSKLKPDQKEVVVMKYITGLTLEEISEVLDVKLSAAKMRLYRSLDSFKQAYNEELEKERQAHNDQSSSSQATHLTGGKTHD